MYHKSRIVYSKFLCSFRSKSWTQQSVCCMLRVVLYVILTQRLLIVYCFCFVETDVTVLCRKENDSNDRIFISSNDECFPLIPHRSNGHHNCFGIGFPRMWVDGIHFYEEKAPNQVCAVGRTCSKSHRVF